MVPQNNRIYVCRDVFSVLTHCHLSCLNLLRLQNHVSQNKYKKILSKQEIGLPSAPLKKIVLKAHKTKLTWANKNKVIMEFLTMGKQNLTVEVTSKLSI